MRILLVTNAFYPEISPRSFRATELAKEFSRQGHIVNVITKSRDTDYAEFSENYGTTVQAWGRSRFPKVPNWKHWPFSIIANAFSRLLIVLFEYPGIEDMFKVKKELSQLEGYDLMISFAVPYPVHWGVAWARNSKHKISKTWIADCGDPYMGDVLDSFRKLFYFGYLEKWFCNKADYISIPVESAKPAYYPEFHEKIIIIPQGFSFELSKDLKEIPNRTVPEFAYAGGFLKGARDPRPLLDYLVKVNRNFKFHIFTNQPELIENYKEILKEKLIISIFIPRDELMKRLSGMDFLVNFDNNTRLNVPSKLIDYAILDKPVLNIENTIDYENVLAFLQGDYRNKMLLPDPEKYHISNISKSFIDYIDT